jgi:hypothetical protein
LMGLDWRSRVSGLSGYDAQWVPAFKNNRPAVAYVTYRLDPSGQHAVSGAWDIKPYRNTMTRQADLFIGYFTKDVREPKL